MELANKTKNEAEIKSFQQQIKKGIPDELPTPQPFDSSLNHAPKRKEIFIKAFFSLFCGVFSIYPALSIYANSLQSFL